MYPFYLVRHQDVSGVSGTGIVAYGVVLPSGQAVMAWNSRFKTVTIIFLAKSGSEHSWPWGSDSGHDRVARQSAVEMEELAS